MDSLVPKALWDALVSKGDVTSTKGSSTRTIFTLLLLAIDALLCFIIVKKVAYTEIDWQPYMEEVQGYLDGERDYVNIRGSTGPLVYPAGFLYVYSMLHHITDRGSNVLLAQYIFIAIYVVNLLVVLLLYRKGKNVPPIMWILLLLSKRIHSIFVLRLFNDCVAVLFGYIAIVFFTHNRYRIGCLSYSFAVSIKMNMFLYAPGTYYTHTYVITFPLFNYRFRCFSYIAYRLWGIRDCNLYKYMRTTAITLGVSVSVHISHLLHLQSVRVEQSI